jgi:fucose permease
MTLVAKLTEQSSPIGPTTEGTTVLHDAKKRRTALFALFLLPGLAWSSWITRTPDVRDQLAASTAEMGLILFGLSIGSILGVLASGVLTVRLGARPVIGIGVSLVVASMFVVGIGTATAQPGVVAFGLFIFGAGMGAAEIAMNVEGAEIERVLSASVLPALHGFFSLGTVIGSVFGIVATAVDFPVLWHLAIVGAVALTVVLAFFRAIPAGTGKTAESSSAATSPRTRVWTDTRLLLIGVIILARAMAEGSANDWLPLLMVDGHGFDATSGSIIFTAFAVSMTVGRLCGGWFLDRFGRTRVVRVCTVLAGIGLALVIFADNQIVAGAAVILWGLGASLGFPVTISAAGESGPDSAARVSLVATIGYVAFLVGPPLLGFLGEANGLRSAMVVVLGLVVVATFLTPALQVRRPTVTAGVDNPHQGS